MSVSSIAELTEGLVPSTFLRKNAIDKMASALNRQALATSTLIAARNEYDSALKAYGEALNESAAALAGLAALTDRQALTPHAQEKAREVTRAIKLPDEEDARA